MGGYAVLVAALVTIGIRVLAKMPTMTMTGRVKLTPAFSNSWRTPHTRVTRAQTHARTRTHAQVAYPVALFYTCFALLSVF